MENEIEHKSSSEFKYPEERNPRPRASAAYGSSIRVTGSARIDFLSRAYAYL
jgi:hypothetical protein